MLFVGDVNSSVPGNVCEIHTNLKNCFAESGDCCFVSPGSGNICTNEAGVMNTPANGR